MFVVQMNLWYVVVDVGPFLCAAVLLFYDFFDFLTMWLADTVENRDEAVCSCR